ncbi:MAG: hypothetical protein IH623_05130 [Verrucomicrobia bacterium]|nr:hypothetical protein [Verrucomicrobiota bacterium]
MSAPAFSANSPTAFLRAEPTRLREWVMQRPANLVWFCITATVFGAGVYGAVMGCWRDPWQALYTGIKLPLVILLTTLGNGLLNGMLAPLLGFNATFRQSLTIVLLTFATASVILGALSPVALFVVWSTPPLSVATQLSSPEYGFMQLTLAVLLASAGVAGNVHVLPLLTQWTRSVVVARKVLLAWLAGNLFLGSQICWLLRPFIWDPAGPTRFIGREYFRGSFYETVFEAVRRLLFS